MSVASSAIVNGTRPRNLNTLRARDGAAGAASDGVALGGALADGCVGFGATDAASAVVLVESVIRTPPMRPHSGADYRSPSPCGPQ
ncbi:hypothetical protein GCM10009717_27930 [Agromyces allii]|uniref:Uncharacterized protein n=1 Tax=Agromyces allii TaxID=393607 RepID=A0ABN2QXB0_9MICO